MAARMNRRAPRGIASHEVICAPHERGSAAASRGSAGQLAGSGPLPRGKKGAALANAHAVSGRQGEDKIMATIDDVVSAVAAEKTVVDSAVALLNQLTAMLQAAIASGDPAKIQPAIDAINANKAELADAVTANTPAAP